MYLYNIFFSLFTIPVVLAAPQSYPRQATVREVYQFPNATAIENLAQTHRGELLLSTFSLGRLYSLNPDDLSPSPRIVASLPDVDSLTGIVEIAPNIFAVSAGVNAGTSFVDGTAAVFVVDVRAGVDRAVFKRVARVPDAKLLNGMAALPARPGVVLSADSASGKLFRIDTRTGAVDVAIADPLLAPSGQPNTPPFGVNGIEIVRDSLYLTNSGRGFFGKVKITPNGDKAGDIQVIASLGGSPAPNRGYDDFALVGHGTAYVCVQPDSLVQIAPNGQQTLIAGGQVDPLDAPTSALIDKKGRRLFVTTIGAAEGLMGQVLAITRS